MAQSIQGDDQKKAKTDVAQRRKDWLHSNFANYVHEQRGAEHEGHGLRPCDRTLRVRRLRHGVRIGRFPRVIVEMFFGRNQSFVSTTCGSAWLIDVATS